MRAPQLYSPDASVAIAVRSHGDGLGKLANDAVRATRAADTRSRMTIGFCIYDVTPTSCRLQGVVKTGVLLTRREAQKFWVGLHTRLFRTRNRIFPLGAQTSYDAWRGGALAQRL